MGKATNMARHLKWMDLTQQMKEKIVQANILPAGLYGVEAACISKKALNKLRSAVADAIGCKGHRRNVSMTFTCARASKDLDPLVYVLQQRIMGLRRMCAKNSGLKGRIGLIIKRYNAKQHFNRSKGDLWDELEPDDDDSEILHAYGPVGLLMHSLQAVDCALTDNLEIVTNHRPNVSIYHTPVQHLKTAVHEIAIRHRDGVVNSNRTYCGHCDNIDHDVLKEVHKSLGTAARNILNYVSTGAKWSEEDLAKIDRGDGNCPHCGAANASLTHKYWKCPVIKDKMKDTELKDVDPDLLPDAIKAGIPTAMSSSFTKNYWVVDDDAESLDNTIKAQSKDETIKAICAEKGFALPKFAKDTFLKLKGGYKQPFIPKPPKCSAKAPADINVYTDGSWLNPLLQYLGLGGAGVWWPGRALGANNLTGLCANNIPPSDPELEMATLTQRCTGVQVYTPLGGFAGSSTRTEIAAGILAISANGPIHIGSDSKAFVDRASKILKDIRRGRAQPRKPWNLMSDGDMWEHFHAVACHKGANAIALTWVKGHATNEHIEKGITTHTHKCGNDNADEVANIAANLHGKDVVDAAKWYHCKRKNYVDFMKKVAIHIVEAHTISNVLLEEAEAAKQAALAHQDKGVYYAKLAYPPATPNGDLKPTYCMGNYSSFCKANPDAQTMQDFISGLHHNPQGPRATTWLELFVLFHIRGYKLTDKNVSRPADQRVTADQALRKFKNGMRATLERIFLASEDANLFKPGVSKFQPLSGLAIHGPVACIATSILVSSKEQDEIAKQLIRLSRQLTEKNLGEFLSGKRALAPKAFALNGRADWYEALIQTNALKHGAQTNWMPANPKHPTQKMGDTNGASSSSFCTSHGTEELLRSDNHQRSPCALGTKGPAVTYFNCPSYKCGKVKPSYIKDFTYHDLESAVACIFCRKKTHSKDWRCSCGTLWHSCLLHRSHVEEHQLIDVPESEPSIMPMVEAPSRGTKRDREQATPNFLDLYEADHERAVKRANPKEFKVVTLGDDWFTPVIPSKLPESLRKRFSSLVQR